MANELAQFHGGTNKVYVNPKPWELLLNIDVNDNVVRRLTIDTNKYSEIFVEMGNANSIQAYGGTVAYFPWTSGITVPSFYRWSRNTTVDITDVDYLFPSQSAGKLEYYAVVRTVVHKFKIWAR